MTAVATRHRSRRSRAGAGQARVHADLDGATEATLFDERSATAGVEPTLEELALGLWDGLTAHRGVCCPICGGEMAPGYGAHAQTVAGRCGDCGTTLT